MDQSEDKQIWKNKCKAKLLSKQNGIEVYK